MDRHYLESVYKVDILSPSPTPPLKGGAILLPSPLRGEGKGGGNVEVIHRNAGRTCNLMAWQGK